MGIGSPDLPAHPDVVTALKESFSNPKVHQYQSYQGIPELRIAIAKFYLRLTFKSYKSSMHIGIQLAKHGLSTNTMSLGGMRKVLQMCVDGIVLGVWPTKDYPFAEMQ